MWMATSSATTHVSRYLRGWAFGTHAVQRSTIYKMQSFKRAGTIWCTEPPITSTHNASRAMRTERVAGHLSLPGQHAVGGLGDRSYDDGQRGRSPDGMVGPEIRPIDDLSSALRLWEQQPVLPPPLGSHQS
jgi:hypothetical protein